MWQELGSISAFYEIFISLHPNELIPDWLLKVKSISIHKKFSRFINFYLNYLSSIISIRQPTYLKAIFLLQDQWFLFQVTWLKE